MNLRPLIFPYKTIVRLSSLKLLKNLDAIIITKSAETNNSATGRWFDYHVINKN